MYKGICSNCGAAICSGHRITICWDCEQTTTLTEKMSDKEELAILQDMTNDVACHYSRLETIPSSMRVSDLIDKLNEYNADSLVRLNLNSYGADAPSAEFQVHGETILYAQHKIYT